MAVISVKSRIDMSRRRVGELRGVTCGVENRMEEMRHRIDDMHRLLMVLITVVSGCLSAATVGMILKLVN